MSLLLGSLLIALAAAVGLARAAAPPASYCRLASISINCRPTRLELS